MKRYRIISVVLVVVLVMFLVDAAMAENGAAKSAVKKGIFLKSRTMNAEPEGQAGYRSAFVSEEMKIRSELDFSQKDKVHAVIQLDHIPSPEEKRLLAEGGISLLSYIPEDAWLASVDSRSVSDYSESMITFVSSLQPQDKHDPSLFEQVISGCETERCTASFFVACFEDVPDEACESVISGYADVDRKDLNGWIVSAEIDDIDSLLSEDEIKWVEIAFKGKSEMNNGTRKATGVRVVQAYPFSLNGTGVVVAEWDSTWAERTHGDLSGRVTRGDSSGSCQGCYCVSCSEGDHSTHVAGTMIGSGANSNYVYRGMAPNSTLRTYEWPDYGGELYSETRYAVRNGSVLSQNSWGWTACYNGSYDAWSRLYDKVVRGENSTGKVSVIFSAGNNGPNYNTSCGPGGTAKNTISVGSVDSDDFAIDGYSSRGPTDDGRIKPDVVAPGCEDEPSRNDNNPSKTIWSTVTGNSYSGSCGTSMAAPAVSGIVALLHQAYRQNNSGVDQLPSTDKAILAHTARDLGNTGPDFTYGWGLVNATKAVQLIRDDARNNLIRQSNISANAEKDTYQVYVGTNHSWFKVTLAWDDYAGDVGAARELVNNLDLVVVAPNGTRYHPWKLDPYHPSDSAARNSTDNINNIEQVYVINPINGTWNVSVNGTSVPQPYQEYSLVYSHDNTAPNITSFYQDAARVNITEPNSTTFNISAVDINNDTLNYTWYQNGTLKRYGVSADEWNFSGSYASSGYYNITVFVSDGYASTMHSWVLFVNNTNLAPNVSFANISPSSPGNNTDLTCLNGSTSDFDNDSIIFFYDWYNGSEWMGFNSMTLLHGNTTINSSWNCSIIPNDGDLNGTRVVSSSVVINNSAPNITSSYPSALRVNISEPNSQVFNISYSDSDSCTLRWTLNGTSVSSSASYTFTGSYTRSGIYNVSVIVNDSYISSYHSWVLNVSDTNRKPSLSSNIPNITIYQNSSTVLNLSYYFSDPDGDSVSYSAKNCTNLTYSINNTRGTVNITPLLNWSGISYIRFNVTDGMNFTLSNNITVRSTRDNDSDGVKATGHQGNDCDDRNAAVYPGASCTRTGYTGSTYDSSCTCAGGTAVTTSSSSGGGGGGGGGSVAPATSKESRYYSEIAQGSEIELPVAKRDIPITKIRFDALSSMKAVSISVESVSGSSLPDPDSAIPGAYGYVKIDHENLDAEGISDANIDFKVNRSWLSQNGFSKGDVVMRRLRGTWQQLETSYVRESDDAYYYTAKTPGFSFFAITAEKKEASADKGDASSVGQLQQDNLSVSPETPESNATADNVTSAADESRSGRKFKMPDIRIMIIGVSLVVALILFLTMVISYAVESKDFQEKVHELEHYINKRLSVGHHEKDIHKDLKAHGWKSSRVPHLIKDLKKKHLIRKAEEIIPSLLKKGHPDEHIHNELAKHGMKRSHVKKHIKRFKDERAKEVAELLVRMGHEDEMISAELAKQGIKTRHARRHIRRARSTLGIYPEKKDDDSAPAFEPEPQEKKAEKKHSLRRSREKKQQDDAKKEEETISSEDQQEEQVLDDEGDKEEEFVRSLHKRVSEHLKERGVHEEDEKK